MSSISSSSSSTTTTTTVQFFEELKESLVRAFMNVPQIDGRNNTRVPVDLAVESHTARSRVMETQNGSYWATVPQLPIASSSA